MDCCHPFLSEGSELQYLFPQHCDKAENILVLIRFLLGYCASNPQQFQNLATASRGKLCQPCFFCLTFCPGREPLKSWLPLQPQTAMLCLSSLIECEKYCLKNQNQTKQSSLLFFACMLASHPPMCGLAYYPRKKKVALKMSVCLSEIFFFFFLPKILATKALAASTVILSNKCLLFLILSHIF